MYFCTSDHSDATNVTFSYFRYRKEQEREVTISIIIIIISLHKSWTKLRLSRNFLCDSNNNALTLILEADKHHDPWSKSFLGGEDSVTGGFFFQVWCWQICAHPSWILAIQRCVKLLCFSAPLFVSILLLELLDAAIGEEKYGADNWILMKYRALTDTTKKTSPRGNLSDIWKMLINDFLYNFCCP